MSVKSELTQVYAVIGARSEDVQGLRAPKKWAKRYESIYLSSLVPTQFMQSSCNHVYGRTLDLRVRDLEDFTNGQIVSVARPS